MAWLKEASNFVAQKAASSAEKLNCSHLGYYAGLWHDLGKYNPEFQDYLQRCEQANRISARTPLKSVPHAVQGAMLAASVFEPLAYLIYGHHAGLPDPSQLKNSLNNPKFSASFEAVCQDAAAEGISLMPTHDLYQAGLPEAEDTLGWELFLRLLFSCLVDADYLDTERHFDLEQAELREHSITVDRLWPLLEQSQHALMAGVKDKNTVVNQVRAEVYDRCVKEASQAPGIFRLCVPTGGGKTRSGLAFALRHAALHNLDRVIVAIPYTSIIEQTAGVYREIFESLGSRAVLEHHSATQFEGERQQDSENQTRDKVYEEDARKEFAAARLATQNWDAALVVTTTVQLFESLFARKPSRCRKLHNLVGSVIVLDEVQTLPVALLEPILSVLRALVERYRVSVVLCTATQPAFEGETPYLKVFPEGSVRDIVPRNRARKHFQQLSRVSYDIPASTESWDWKRLASDLTERGHQSALIILNTRKDALDVLNTLSAVEHENIFHLSTLLCGVHRRRVLEEVRQRLHSDRPCLLVSTQVVEAGVDLDFPLVYRAIGPLDRIVQAAGRCNREGTMSDKGEVIIFRPAEGRQPLGEYREAVDTAQLLLERDDIDLHNPEIFENYFRLLYQTADIKLGEEIQQYRSKLKYPKVAELFRLIDGDTMPVVVDFDNTSHQRLEQIRHRGCVFASDRRFLQPYIVNLRRYEFQSAEDCREEIVPGLWLWKGVYDRQLKGITLSDRPIEYDPLELIL